MTIRSQPSPRPPSVLTGTRGAIRTRWTHRMVPRDIF